MRLDEILSQIKPYVLSWIAEQVSAADQYKTALDYERVEIDSGVITKPAGRLVTMSVDTEGGIASDNLNTINGGVRGDILIIRAANDARTVILKDGTGNLVLAGDHTLDNSQDSILLVCYTNWVELSRSNNG